MVRLVMAFAIVSSSCTVAYKAPNKGNYELGVSYTTAGEDLRPSPDAIAIVAGKIPWDKLATARMSVELILRGFQVEDGAFTEVEDPMELILYAQIQSEGKTRGELTSTLEPQKSDYFQITQSRLQALPEYFTDASTPPNNFYSVNTLLFGRPLLFADEKANLSFHLVEFDQIGPSVKARVKKVYELFNATTNLALEKGLIESAASTPWTAYIPLIGQAWELFLGISELVDGDENLTDSPQVLVLQHRYAYLPKETDYDKPLKAYIQLLNESKPQLLAPSSTGTQDLATSVNGNVEGLIYCFRTKPIKGVRLCLEVRATPLKANAP